MTNDELSSLACGDILYPNKAGYFKRTFIEAVPINADENIYIVSDTNEVGGVSKMSKSYILENFEITSQQN